MNDKHDKQPFIITIDGPAGAGKTSIAKRLAKTLPGFSYLDTGAVYRAMAYTLTNAGFAAADFESNRGACLDVIYNKQIEIAREKNGVQTMLVSGATVPDEFLRTPEISEMSSQISADPIIRMFAKYIINNAEPPEMGFIAEGRDTGTALFPNANLKFYLFASIGVRASRRVLQRGQFLSDEHVSEAIKELDTRDSRDIQRTADPLKCAEDMLWINTNDLSEDVVLNLILGMAMCRINPRSVSLA